MTDFWAGGVSQGAVPVPKIDWDEVRRKQTAAIAAKKDPYQWKKPVQKAAQKRIVASARPQAAAAPPPPKTSKQILDEYRAANGGALPPGMSPEVAALIDSGVDLEALKLSNPMAAQSIQAIQAQLLAMPSAYDASKAKISSDYANLTGDVETAGADWMKQLYGNIAPDPNDPNAAQFAADPAFAGYANTLGRIEETGDINEATDLAWFTKNQQAQQAYLNSLLTGVAGGTIPVGAAIEGGGSGGGGGGGGRGGGYGGGGSGGGDSEWTDPKTVSSRQEVDTATDTTQFTDYNREFFEALMAAAGDDPKLQELALSTFSIGGQTPMGVTTQIGKDLLNAQLAADAYELQGEKRAAYEKTIPIEKEQAISDWRNNYGFVRGDDPATDVKEAWYIPQRNSTKQLNLSEKQQVEAEHGQEVWNARDSAIQRLRFNLGAQIPGMEKKPGDWFGLNSLPEKVQKITPQQQELIEAKGREELKAAKALSSKDAPWSYADWEGFVEPVNEQEREQNSWLVGALSDFRNTALSKNPNVSPQITKDQFVLSNQDKDTLKTDQKTYDPNAAVGGNLQGMYPGGVGQDTTPFMGGAGSASFDFDQTPLAAPDYDNPSSIDPSTGLAYIGASGPGITGVMRAIPEKAKVLAEKQSLAALARRRMEKDRGGLGSAMSKGLGGFGAGKTPKPPKSMAAVAEANQPVKTAPKAKKKVANVPPTEQVPVKSKSGLSALEQGQLIKSLYKGKTKAQVKAAKTPVKAKKPAKKRYSTTSRAV